MLTENANVNSCVFLTDGVDNHCYSYMLMVNLLFIITTAANHAKSWYLYNMNNLYLISILEK